MHSHCSGTTEQAFTVVFMNNITNKLGKMQYAKLKLSQVKSIFI